MCVGNLLLHTFCFLRYLSSYPRITASINLPLAYVPDVLLNHLLQILDNLRFLDGDAVKGFVHLVGVEHVVGLVGMVVEDETDVGVGGGGEDDGAGEIAHRRAVEVREAEDGGHGGAFALLRLYVETAAGLLGVLLQQRQSEAHLAGGAGGEKRVDNLLDGFGIHSAAVVNEADGEGVGSRILDHLQCHLGGTGAGGVLQNVHYVHR